MDNLIITHGGVPAHGHHPQETFQNIIGGSRACMGKSDNNQPCGKETCDNIDNSYLISNYSHHILCSVPPSSSLNLKVVQVQQIITFDHKTSLGY